MTDIIVLAIIILVINSGFIKGFRLQLVSMVSLFVSFFATYSTYGIIKQYAYQYAKDFFKSYITTDFFFTALYLLLILIFYIIIYRIIDFATIYFYKYDNKKWSRFLGLFVGVLNGIIIVSILFIITLNLSLPILENNLIASYSFKVLSELPYKLLMFPDYFYDILKYA